MNRASTAFRRASSRTGGAKRDNYFLLNYKTKSPTSSMNQLAFLTSMASE